MCSPLTLNSAIRISSLLILTSPRTSKCRIFNIVYVLTVKLNAVSCPYRRILITYFKGQLLSRASIWFGLTNKFLRTLFTFVCVRVGARMYHVIPKLAESCCSCLRPHRLGLRFGRSLPWTSGTACLGLRVGLSGLGLRVGLILLWHRA